MRRREFLRFLSGVATAPFAGLCAVNAQPKKRIPRVGVLWHAGNAEEEGDYFTSLVAGLTDLGYVEGQTIALEHRYANEQYERFGGLASELVALNVDVLVAVTRLAAAAAQAASTSIPIVFVVVNDPVGNKFARSLARPGYNMTGLAILQLDITSKRLEYLKEAIPGISDVGLLVNPREAVATQRMRENLEKEAAALRLAVQTYEARSPTEIDSAFSRMAHNKIQAVYMGNDPMLFNERRRIAKLGLAYRIPVMSSSRMGTEAGALISYGSDTRISFRRVGYYVHKVLRGEKPGDLPIEQPSKFELLINLKTAKALGTKIPETLLIRADELIE